MFKFAQRSCVFTMAVTGLLAQTPATTPTEETRTSGVVGIAQGQTARFNVLNPALTASATTTTTAAPCTAVLTYYDGGGVLLKTSSVTVAPGTIGYLDLFSDVNLGLAAGQRKQIRATVAVPLAAATTADAKAKPVCRLIGTLEIFDEITGRADVVLGDMHIVKSDDADTTTPASAVR